MIFIAVQSDSPHAQRQDKYPRSNCKAYTMVPLLLNHFSIDQKPIHGSDRRVDSKVNDTGSDPEGWGR
jgi:hypothetical protein